MKKTDEIKEFSGYCENADNISEYTYTDNQYFSVGEEYSAQLKEGSSDKTNGTHLHKKKNLIQKMGYAVTAVVSMFVILQTATMGGYDESIGTQSTVEVEDEKQDGDESGNKTEEIFNENKSLLRYY